MIKRFGEERRQYPRILAQLPLKITADEYSFSTNSQNLSCVGAYCRLNRYIPPFTKLAVKICLPTTGNKRLADNDVECKGVIVRSEDDKTDGFNIAIFFNEIKNNQRQKISRYLSQFMPK